MTGYYVCFLSFFGYRYLGDGGTGCREILQDGCVFSPFGGGAPRGSPNPKFAHPLYGGYCILLTELFCILFKTSLIPTLMFIILRDYQPEGKTAGFHIIIMCLLCRLIDSE